MYPSTYRTTCTRWLLLCLLLVVSARAWSDDKIKLPSHKDEWFRIETDKFVLFGRDDERGVDIGRELERLHAALARLFPLMQRHSPLHTYVYMFEDDREFERYVEWKRTSGIFMRTRHGNYVAINAERYPLDIVFHEYTHYLVASNLRKIPTWLNEGLAEYFSTFTSEGGVVEIGGLLSAHLRWLREEEFMPLEQLFAITRESPEYNEGERRGTFYAQSWATVHYLCSLRNGMQRLQQLSGFLGLLDSDVLLQPALQEAFSVSAPQLPKRVKDYVYDGRYTKLRISLNVLAAGESVHVERLPYVEVLYHLGDFLAERGPDGFAAARAHFDAALARHPTHGPALGGLGYIRAQSGARQEAAGLFARALQADAPDAKTRLLAAENLIELAQRQTGTAHTSTPDEILQARGLLHAAVETDPELTLAQALLGYTYTFGDQDPSPGIAALQVATAAYPSDENSAYNLFLLYLQAGNLAAADAIEKRILRFSEDPERRANAREALLRLEAGQVDSLMAANKHEEALALVRRIGGEAEDAAFVQELEQLASRIEDFAVKQRDIEAYNRAVGHANRREYTQAERILVGLAANAKDPGLKRSATQLLNEVRRAKR